MLPGESGGCSGGHLALRQRMSPHGLHDDQRFSGTAMSTGIIARRDPPGSPTLPAASALGHTFPGTAEPGDDANVAQFAQELDQGLGDHDRGHQRQAVRDREGEWQHDQ